jgi:hypothetical protein
MMRSFLWLPLIVAALTLVSGRACLSQQGNHYARRTLEAKKAEAPPDIDGDVTDVVWRNAPKAETFVDSQNGTVVADQSTAYLVYDAKYIYVGFYCKDSQPGRISARETVQDSKYQLQNNGNGPSDTEDNVEVSFDCFCSHQYGDQSRFSVNAIGTPSAAVAGGRANKVEWKGDWTAAAKRVADGWTAEMRIPWSALNYPNSRQPVLMGINFTRFQVRTQVQSIWSNVGPQGFLEQEGQWKGVEVPHNAFHPALSLLPYSLTSNRGTTPVFRGGLDARYTLTPELTGVGTINPDFSTIENALASIQFTRGQRFVPETRPFFLEGGNIFFPANFNFIGSYLYTNNIPGFDVGTKVYGKLTPQDTIGLLETVNFGVRNDLIARFRHDLSATSNVGAFLIQMSAPNDNNTMGLLTQDTRWGKFELNSQWALSSGHAAGGDAKQLALFYQDKLDAVGLGLADVSPIFRDADGLISFNGYSGVFPFTFWGAQWRKGFWRNYNVGLFSNFQWHTDGRPFQRGGNLDINFTSRQDWNIDFNKNYNVFDQSTDDTYALTLTTNVSNRFRQWGLQFLFGREADRPATFLGPVFSFRVFRKLDVGYNGAVQNLNGVTQQHIMTLNYQVSPVLAIGGRVVIQDSYLNPYFFYRRSGGKGIDYFLILGDPNAKAFVRHLSFKIVYPI